MSTQPPTKKRKAETALGNEHDRILFEYLEAHKGDPAICNRALAALGLPVPRSRPPSCPPSPGGATLAAMEANNARRQETRRRTSSDGEQRGLEEMEVTLDTLDFQSAIDYSQRFIDQVKENCTAEMGILNATEADLSTLVQQEVALIQDWDTFKANRDAASDASEQATAAFDLKDKELKENRAEQCKLGGRKVSYKSKVEGRENHLVYLESLKDMLSELHGRSESAYSTLSPMQGAMIIGTRMRYYLKYEPLTRLTQLWGIPSLGSNDVLGEIYHLHAFGFFDSPLVKHNLGSKGRHEEFERALKLSPNRGKAHYLKELGLAIDLIDDLHLPQN